MKKLLLICIFGLLGSFTFAESNIVIEATAITTSQTTLSLIDVGERTCVPVTLSC